MGSLFTLGLAAFILYSFWWAFFSGIKRRDRYSGRSSRSSNHFV